MKRQERFDYLIEYFSRSMPAATTELDFGSDFQLLVAVVLSAQCTDKRVNQVTPELFARYPTSKELAAAEDFEVLEYIRSVSYPNSKARHLVEMARALEERHGGTIPGTMDELLALPGVGRKTANVMLSVAFGQPAMAVDTHVYRVSRRIGLADDKDDTPLKVEQRLLRHIPKQHVATAHHWLILHGRYVCKARAPQCDGCGLREVCKYGSALKK